MANEPAWKIKAHYAGRRLVQIYLQRRDAIRRAKDTRLTADGVERLARDHRGLITLEQGADGGFGSAVLHHLARRGLFDSGLAIRPMTLPDRFIHQASPTEMYADAGLTVDDICRTAQRIFRPDEKVVELGARA